ncbi:MAG TPA: GyrI-like domain-containing protein [Ruminiclostridium sp.]|nr:GyrI-like domain-containing protein [Ruminiclostridium sp.]
MADKFDFKKAYKDLYIPKQKPVIINVPPMDFIMVDGKGDPNDEVGEYKEAMNILYGLTFTIKMSKMSGQQPTGYFEYVVPPLEGLWWFENDLFDGRKLKDKSQFCWTSMIRQPDFVTDSVFEWAVSQLQKKKPGLNVSKARFVTLEEGLCVQMMHIGPYDSEPASIEQMEKHILENGYENDINDRRRHHEIYLGDPRKVAPQKLRTVLRHPVKKIR